MTLMIDPPSGWKYGFPKAKPDDATNTIAWLLSEGYPQSEIDRNSNTPNPIPNFFDKTTVNQ